MKRIYIYMLALLGGLLVSCNDYLDTAPDNRATIDSRTKIRKILVSAYPSEGAFGVIAEFSSDNMMDLGESNPRSNRFLEDINYWKDSKEEDLDNSNAVWGSYYKAIGHSNSALDAIATLGEKGLEAEKGEALITRAYSHFILVNMFAKHYNKNTSATDLGIVYMEKPETELDPKYKRVSVKEIYEKINADIEAALPLIADNIYEVKSYHFNKKAAYAFAARFNLYYERWEKAKEYATKALGVNPTTELRDWEELGGVTRTEATLERAYTNNPSNWLVQALGSYAGVYFGNGYFYGSRFPHSRLIADNQTLYAPLPWQSSTNVTDSRFNYFPANYKGDNMDRTLYLKIPYLFEYTDPIAGIGFARTVIVPFYADETLLVRAEAKAMLGDFSGALEDLNMWSSNFYKGNVTTTLADINSFYDSMPYSSDDNVNQKNKLTPSFSITSKEQENLLHYILQCRRILTIHEGLRWFDIKRYGIEVRKLQTQSDATVIVVDRLPVNDPRRAIQLPYKVVEAGLEANPR